MDAGGRRNRARRAHAVPRAAVADHRHLGPRHDRDGDARDSPRRVRLPREALPARRAAPGGGSRARRQRLGRPRRHGAGGRRPCARAATADHRARRRRERAGAPHGRSHGAHPPAAAARQRHSLRQHLVGRDGSRGHRPRGFDRLRDHARPRRYGGEDGRAPDGDAACLRHHEHAREDAGRGADPRRLGARALRAARGGRRRRAAGDGRGAGHRPHVRARRGVGHREGHHDRAGRRVRGALHARLSAADRPAGLRVPLHGRRRLPA